MMEPKFRVSVVLCSVLRGGEERRLNLCFVSRYKKLLIAVGTSGAVLPADLKVDGFLFFILFEYLMLNISLKKLT